MTLLDHARQRLAAWPGAALSALLAAVAYAVLICTMLLMKSTGVAADAAGHVLSVATLLPGALAVLCVSVVYGHRPSGLGTAAGLGAGAGVLAVVVGYAAAGVLIALGLLPDPAAVAAEQVAQLPAHLQADARALIAFVQSPVGRLADAVLSIGMSAVGGAAAAWLLARVRRSARLAPAA